MTNEDLEPKTLKEAYYNGIFQAYNEITLALIKALDGYRAQYAEAVKAYKYVNKYSNNTNALLKLKEAVDFTGLKVEALNKVYIYIMNNRNKHQAEVLGVPYVKRHAMPYLKIDEQLRQEEKRRELRMKKAEVLISRWANVGDKKDEH